jgi:perosamine synthetase
MSPPIPITRPTYSEGVKEDILASVQQILTSGRLLNGPFLSQLEDAYREMLGVDYVVGLNTCSTALKLSLAHAGIEGKEVLVPSASFVTDVSTVLELGGKPILVDLDPNDLAIDLDDAKRKLTSRTQAMIWVHLTGIISPRFREIQTFARENDLFLIEDAAHAHGAKADGQIAGSLGDCGCFSFFATKVVASGTGGILATNIAALAEFARETRDFGNSQTTGKMVRLGSDHHLDEFRACVAFHQTKDLENIVGARRTVAIRYSEGLRNQPYIRAFELPEGNLPAYFQYAVLLDKRVNRDDVIREMRENFGIACKRIYLPTHEEVPFQSLDDGTLDRTSQTLDRALCLPMYVGISEEDIERVLNGLKETLRKLI